MLERGEVEHPVRAAEQRAEHGQQHARAEHAPRRRRPRAAPARTARPSHRRAPTPPGPARAPAASSRGSCPASSLLIASASAGAEPVGREHEHRAAHRDRDVGGRPARARERGGEQRLEPARASPRRASAAPTWIAEAGADQRHRQHRDREVLVDDVAPRPSRGCPRSACCRRRRLFGVAAGEPDRDAAEEQPGAPARAARRAGAAARARAGCVSARRGGRRAGPRRDEPGAVVAAGAQRERAADERDRRDERERQRPPALARVRAHRLRPSRSATATTASRRRRRPPRAAGTRRRARAPAIP